MNWPAGSTFYYAKTHLQIAALMAIKATNAANWATLFTTRLANPLGMQDSPYYLPLGNPNPAGGAFVMLLAIATY
jgi:CubicO group peptidase (beta-lactamase class C family)